MCFTVFYYVRIPNFVAFFCLQHEYEAVLTPNLQNDNSFSNVNSRCSDYQYIYIYIYEWRDNCCIREVPELITPLIPCSHFCSCQNSIMNLTGHGKTQKESICPPSFVTEMFKRQPHRPYSDTCPAVYPNGSFDVGAEDTHRLLITTRDGHSSGSLKPL